MIDLLLKPVELTTKREQYLSYGDTIQVMAHGASCSIAVDEYPFKRGHCKLGHMALSASVPPSVIDYEPYLSTNSILSASPLIFPVARNSFVIEDPKDCCNTSVVNYGDVFRLRVAQPTQHFKLYLMSHPAILHHHLATHSAKPKVRLSDVASMETLWSAWPVNSLEQLRMELGVPVPLKKRLYIRHNVSGIKLSTEPQFPVLTYFGTELEVTTDNKWDRVRRPDFPNMWYFDGTRGQPRIEDCKKQFMDQSQYDASINIHMIDKDASAEEKAKEEARLEMEEDNQVETDEVGPTPEEIQQQYRTCYIDEKEFKESMKKEDESKDETGGGQLAYDPRTGPQPHAYSYKVFKDDPEYPNRKWDCGSTNCCYRRAPPPEPYECKDCPCLPPADPEPNPNKRDYGIPDLIR